MQITRMISPYNHSSRQGQRIVGISIHYTGNRTDTALANARYFNGGNRGASAHYFVDGTSIVQVVEEDQAAWAVGRKYANAPYWGKLTNYNSLSIEMCSTNGAISPETMRNTADIVSTLMRKYSIPLDKVRRHYDICGKRCPGWDGWLPPHEDQWHKLKGLIEDFNRERGGNPSPAPKAAPTSTDQPNFTGWQVGRNYTVTVNALNVRDGAGLNHGILKTYPKGTVFTLKQLVRLSISTWGRTPSGWVCLEMKGEKYAR